MIVKRTYQYSTIISIVLLVALIGSPVFGQKSQKKKEAEAQAAADAAADQRASEFHFVEAEKYYILEDYAKALESFQKSLELTPENGAIHFMIAKVKLANEQYDDAATSIDQAIELDPGNKYYYLTAADIHTSQGNFRKAAEYYDRMVSSLPNTDEYYIELAGLYLYENDLEKALQAYEKAEARLGVNEQIFFQKQQIHLKQNNVDKAIEVAQELVDTYPDDSRFVMNLSDVLYVNGKEEEAIDLLKTYLKETPTASRIKILLAQYYRDEEEIKKAGSLLDEAFSDIYLDPQAKIQLLVKYIAYFPQETYVKQAKKLGQTLIETHPDNGDVYLVNADMLSELLARGEKDPDKKIRMEAAGYYFQSIEKDPSKFSVWQNLLNLELQLGNWEDLATHSEQALELFPNNSLIYLFAGISNQQKKEYSKAIEYYEQGRKMASDPQILSSFYSGLGDSYNAIKDYTNSDKNYEKAIEISPENDIVLNNYSYFLSLRNEKLQKAKKMSQDVVRRNPNNSAYLDTFAWVLYKLEEYDEAKRLLERAIEIQESNAVYYDHYGDILFQLGEINAAVKNWQKAQSIDKNLENINEKIRERKVIE